jgi:isoquinoline 1-oxidoreductase subunit beta
MTALRVTRRGFLAGLGAASVGLALGLEGIDRIEAAPGAATFAPNPFVQIGSDGVVTIVCHRSEMGQGVRSSLPVLIADELGADPARVRIVQADGDPRYGDQNTDGSTSVRKLYEAMRQVGAVARTLLVTAAARRWRVPAKRLTTRDDAVHDPVTRRQLPFAALVAEAAKLPVPETAPLRPRGELVHVGTDLPLRDGDAYVTGTATFAADVRLPGMLTAVIARPPDVFGSVDTFDAARARAIPGVRLVTELPAATPPALSKPLGGVAVVADHTWAALRGRAALDIRWRPGSNATHDTASYTQELRASVAAPGTVVRELGDAEAALASAARRVEAEYLVPQLAHAPMEPPAAVARFDGDRCEVWTCTQSPQDARDALAGALDLDREKVTVHVTFLGGGFGRKSIPDFAIEAALLAREARAPVRVQWTRDDDLRHGYYHAPSVQALAAGLDARGNVVAWRHRLAYPPIASTFLPTAERPAGEVNQGVLDLPLAIPNIRVETGRAPAHSRIGWLRSVANIQQGFAVQSFIAELAHATGRDPRDMLATLLGDPKSVVDPRSLGVEKLSNYGAPLDQHPISIARFLRVIDAVTTASRWEAARKAGAALGLAVHRSFLSYVAVVARVEKAARGGIRVEEAWIAADCGTIINADRVRAQLEGAFLFGQTIALHGAITMKRGAVEQTNFRDYPLARITEAPRRIHIELIASDARPGGVGEPGVPPVAPAIASAVFALTGTRIRALPIEPRSPVA